MAGRNEDFFKASKDIVNQLAVIVRTAQIHNTTNVAVQTSIEKFIVMINSLFEQEGTIDLELIGEYFYLNEERVKYSMEHLINFDFLQREFKKRHLGSLRFVKKLNPEETQAFVKAFINSQYAPDPFEDLSKNLEPLKGIECGKIRKIVEDEQDLRKTVKRTYFNAVSFTKGVMNKIKAGERISMKKAKRVVESMVDVLLEREEFLLGMTAIKNYDEYTFHHSVNVSILSIALGQRIGLNKKALMDLGIVSLFHDVGKTEVPPEVLNKPSNFTPEEWEVMKRHTQWGVKVIFRMKNFESSSMRAAIAAYEHHIHHDHTGYPKVKKLSDLDLYSRIVSISDQYDAMTSARVYSRSPLSPDRALSMMVKREGVQLDALLLKFFVNMVGVYPVGSLVMLDSREMGIVSGANASDQMRPKVTVITDKQGNKIQPFIADLMEKSPEDQYLRTIQKALDPNLYKINIADYLL